MFKCTGEGPRACIGSRFGKMQVKLAIVKLLTNFEIKVCEKTPIPLKFKASAPFLAPVGDMHLELKRLKF